MEKATRQQTKEHNIQLVLKTIYHQGEISRADVARITRLTRTTVSDIVSQLIDDGLLEETGVGSPAGGKPPILLNVRADSRQLICMDLSGDDFRGALVNLKGQINQRVSLPVNGQHGEEALLSVYRLIDSLVNTATTPLVGIGIGTPGLTDSNSGVVRRAVHLGWNDLPLKHLLETRYGLPIYIANDSHIAAMAEYTFGEMSQAPNLIVIKIGEGIGAGIVLLGKVHYGDGFGAGEIGHLTVAEGGRLCSCGNYGCLETVSSTRAILRRMQELAEYEWISFAQDAASRQERMDWEFVRQAFETGDETVTELIKEAGRYLGVSIANLIGILNIHNIVISGSYVEFSDIFLNEVKSEVQRRTFSTIAAETQILNSSLGSDIVILGATALVLSQEMGLP